MVITGREWRLLQQLCQSKHSLDVGITSCVHCVHASMVMLSVLHMHVCVCVCVCE